MSFKKIIHKNIDRYYYMILLVSLNTGYLVSNLLSLYYWIFPVRRIREIDIIFFPYAQPGSDGYKRRFEVYLNFLTKEKISYIICDLIDDKKLTELLEGTNHTRYKTFRKLFFKRLKQVQLAKRCKAAFVQRGLFVAFPDQKFPYLERLLRRLNENITIDFWDSFWAYNNKLVDKAASYSHKISCVNEFVISHFNFLYQPKLLFPIGLDVTPYVQKNDYSIKDKVTFIYTGNPQNVKQFLERLSNVFIELNKRIDFKLVLITRLEKEICDFPVEFYEFKESTFYNHLVNADIGLYAIEDNEISRGKMAMKVLDYMAAALPSVASPYGITPYAINNQNILIAETDKEWVSQILKLTQEKDLRERIGRNGYETIIHHHEIKRSYELFSEIVFRNKTKKIAN